MKSIALLKISDQSIKNKAIEIFKKHKFDNMYSYKIDLMIQDLLIMIQNEKKKLEAIEDIVKTESFRKEHLRVLLSD